MLGPGIEALESERRPSQQKAGVKVGYEQHYYEWPSLTGNLEKLQWAVV